MDKTAKRFVSRLAARPVPAAVRQAPPGVTIAIPNWNHEYVLPRSVGSALRGVRVLRAAGVDAEVLVVDDRSRDGSPTLLRQMEALHAGDGLRVLALRRNVGLPTVRNVALGAASYASVVFMDADNELLPENLPHFQRAMAQTGAAAVYGNLLCRRAGDRTEVMSGESVQDRLFEANYIDAFAMFDRHRLLDAGGFLDAAEVEAREDWEAYLHLAAAGAKVVFVPLVFGVYHELPGSMIDEGRHEHGAQREHLRRMYDQLGVRPRMPMNTRHLRYHPEVGYI